MDFLTIVVFLAGAVIGAGVCYAFVLGTRSESKVERQMRELQEEFTAYRENVNQHFNKTAQLVNNLTDNYIAMQKHLEDAAVSFAEPPKSFTLEKTETLPVAKTDFVSLEDRQKQELRAKAADAEFDASSHVEPPKDYAPKGKAGEKGQLAEDFGLDSKVI